MTQKQNIRNGMKVFLVTSDSVEYHEVMEGSYTILADELRRRLHGTTEPVRVRRDNNYIKGIVEREIGLPVVIYERNLHTARIYLNRLEISGLIIPVGHGDINSIGNLGFKSPQDVGIPVFEAHKHFPRYRGYEGSLTCEEIEYMKESERERIVMDDFKAWVVQHFKTKL
ncbi:hypothetical protein HY500_01860 [Candidatus Woesearchaeota archaeon]|nr:hypothetical protein [Candidatus Woesearchaeota archaeon]